MPPSRRRVAVVVLDAAAPGAAQRRILDPADEGRVLHRDARLVVEAVDHPGPHLVGRAAARRAAGDGTDAGRGNARRRCGGAAPRMRRASPVTARTPCRPAAIPSRPPPPRPRSRAGVEHRVSCCSCGRRPCAPMPSAREGGHRAVRPVDRHMAHAPAGLACRGRAGSISSSGQSVPSKKTSGAPRSRSASAGVSRAQPGDVEGARRPRRSATPTVCSPSRSVATSAPSR